MQHMKSHELRFWVTIQQEFQKVKLPIPNCTPNNIAESTACDLEPTQRIAQSISKCVFETV